MIEQLAGLFSNQYFTGMVSAGALGAAAMIARKVPSHLKTLARRYGSTEMTIYSEDGHYYDFNVWLGRHPSSAKNRKLRVYSSYRDDDTFDDEDEPDDSSVWNLIPGLGTNWFFYKRVLVVVERSKNDEGNSNRRRETLKLTFYTRRRSIADDFVKEVWESRPSKARVRISVNHGNYWTRLNSNRFPRSIDSIIIDDGIKNSIISDVNSFLEGKEWYAERGIPYHRGYALFGPPGTGKSSLIFALASLIKREIHLLNLNTTSDSALNSLFANSSDKIIVIEDIDLFQVAQARSSEFAGVHHTKKTLDTELGILIDGDDYEDGDDTVPRGKTSSTRSSITSLSALLNVMDGITSPDGLIVFVTSNDPSSLDSALLRPGRIDRAFTLDYPNITLVRRMVARFFPNVDVEQHITSDMHGISPAAIQGLAMKNIHDFDNFVKDFRYASEQATGKTQERSSGSGQ